MPAKEDQNDDEQLLRQRMREVRIGEFKREIGGKPAGEGTGLGLVRSLGIVLTMLALVVAAMLAFLPPN